MTAMHIGYTAMHLNASLDFQEEIISFRKGYLRGRICAEIPSFAAGLLLLDDSCVHMLRQCVVPTN